MTATTQSFEIAASCRQTVGKGASRRLRRQDLIPAVVYGADKPAMSLTLDHKKVLKALENKMIYSHILNLTIDSHGTESVVLKAIQRHPYKPRLLHIDFLRIRANEKLHITVPLHFTGADEAPGVKAGGQVSHIESSVEVVCLPAHLPESLTIDLSHLELDQVLHLSDIKLPKGVELNALLHHQDKPIVAVHIHKEEPETTETEAAVAEEGDKPEAENTEEDKDE